MLEGKNNYPQNFSSLSGYLVYGSEPENDGSGSLSGTSMGLVGGSKIRSGKSHFEKTPLLSFDFQEKILEVQLL